MPSPEGYRKVLRAAKMADKFQIPILMLLTLQVHIQELEQKKEINLKQLQETYMNLQI